MKLIKTVNEVRVEKEYPGLLKLDVKHDIKSSKADLEWKGPSFDPEEWKQVLAFFRWVNTTSDSEAQVRLYVNTAMWRWAFWAYPQKAGTGMSAQELETTERAEQRKQFNESEGWIYFGTAHSHCSMSAFQSSVDESNERTQAGLHLTVGHLNKNIYDLHARFYLNELCFEPDLSLFWDIGDEARNLVPDGLQDLVARHQMSKPPADNQAFPDVWRTNLVRVERVVTTCPQQTGGFVGSSHVSGMPYYRRVEVLTDEFIEDCLRLNYTDEQIVELAELLDSPLVSCLIRDMKFGGITPAALLNEVKFMHAKGWKRNHTTFKGSSNQLQEKNDHQPEAGWHPHMLMD